jgi:hypothetical protein
VTNRVRIEPLGSVRLAIVLCAVACLTPLYADTITVSGAITQSTQDGTGPAMNNPSLNHILDGDTFTLTLNTAETIAFGTQDLTGSSLVFSVPDGSVFESNFGFTSLTVAKMNDIAEFSLFACLTSGSGCNQGNELDVSFMVPSTNLNAQNVVAREIPGLIPLDLLEDDGVTDLQGSIATYSGAVTSSVPEPSPLVLSGLGLGALLLGRIRRKSSSKFH